MFTKSLSSILSTLDKTVAELEAFTEKNAVVVHELAVKLDAANAEQQRAERVLLQARCSVWIRDHVAIVVNRPRTG